MTFIIRPALAGDAHAVGNLAQQFAGYLRGLGDPTEFKLTAESYLRDGFGVAPAFAGLVAEDRGNLLGYLLYHFGYDSDKAVRNLHIVDLYVDSAVRRRGVGTALMSRAANIAREARAQELMWAVFHPNTLAIKFYERLGARRVTDVFIMNIQADEI